MKVIKIIIISIAVIIGLVLIARPVLYLYSECAGYFYKKAFLAKYEFEDFSPVHCSVLKMNDSGSA